MTPTEKMLVEIYGSPILNTEDLAKVFKLTDAAVVRNMVSKGTFYVPTYKLKDGSHSPLVADVPVVAAYLDNRPRKKAA